MWKYYLLLVVALALVLAYTYVADPCNRLLRTEFAQRNPSYVILDSGADKGAPEIVDCRVSYRKPGDTKVYQDTWVYQFQKTHWELSRVVEADAKKQTP
jgi:hypothetical protein